MKEHVNTCVYEYVRVGCVSGKYIIPKIPIANDSGQIYILQWAD